MVTTPTAPSFLQRTSLVILRTLIGWHFLYEGYYKLVLPGWSASGDPLPAWSAAGYLKAATGPLASMLHALAASDAMRTVDILVPVGLALVGVSLMLGVFTQLGCVGAILFLALFYVSAIPTSGLPQAGAEGTYLIVNKNLIELAAVMVVLTFRTGRIAGFDVWRGRRIERATGPEDARAAGPVDEMPIRAGTRIRA
jgi:thiosulfate dehydrogenase (quinone) large subunit